MISIRVYPHSSSNIKEVEGRSLGWLLHPVQSTDSFRVWACQEYGNWEWSIFKSRCRGRCCVCLSAIMAAALSAIQSGGRILMVCSILLTYLSVYSVPFLISLQCWCHPFQSNFSRHLYMAHNMYNCLNSSLSCFFSISHSNSFVTLLGCPSLLQFRLRLWAHHALLPPLPPLVPPLGIADLCGQWLQRSSSSPIVVPTITIVYKETLEIAFTRVLNWMTNKYFDH